jgi:hypothetical protein
MQQDKFIETLGGIFKECIDLAKTKNSDYAKVEDALENFRDFGTMGIIVRLGDKYKRLKNIIQKGEMAVSDEKVKDTLMDLIVYGAIAVMIEQEGPISKYLKTGYCKECHIAIGGKRVPKPRKRQHRVEKVCWRCKPGCGIYSYCAKCWKEVNVPEYEGYRAMASGGYYGVRG